MVRKWCKYPVGGTCTRVKCDEVGHDTEEGLFCLEHWLELPKCSVCGHPGKTKMKVEGEFKFFCRSCLVGDDKCELQIWRSSMISTALPASI